LYYKDIFLKEILEECPFLLWSTEQNKKMEEKSMITADQKKEIIEKYARTAGDTGSPEVQVALLTARITCCTSILLNDLFLLICCNHAFFLHFLILFR
jgi:hypothetical protein